MALLVCGGVEKLEGFEHLLSVLVEDEGDQDVEILGNAVWGDHDAWQFGFFLFFLLLLL